MIRRGWNSWMLPLSVVLGAVSYFVFHLMAEYPMMWSSDLPLHANFTVVTVRLGVPFGHFLLFLVTAALSGFTTDLDRVSAVFPPLLTVAVLTKLWLSAHYGRQVVHHGTGWAAGPERTLQPWALRWFTVRCALLMVAFSLPVGTIYLGQIPPNVFHNPTTILLMPMALALFWTSWRYLQQPSTRLAAWITVLALLNIAAKPVFVPSWMVVFPLFALLRFGRSRELVRAAVPVVAATIALAVQFWYIFNSEATRRFEQARGMSTREGGIALDPFFVWDHYSLNLPLSVLASFLFPLVALAVSRGRLLRDPLWSFAAAHVVVALGAFVLLTERGDTALHANFMWFVVVANCMWFAVTLFWLERERLARPGVISRGGVRWADAAFYLHAAAGVFVMMLYLTQGMLFETEPLPGFDWWLFSF